MKKPVIGALFAVIGVSTLSLGLTAVTLGWFIGAGGETDQEMLDGEIGLRGYFFSGNGSEEYPYEIVSPVHLYNLSRLQNLGIFPEKQYFQIGHVFDEEDGPQCINSDGVYADYLDMGPFCASTTFRPIGSESTPFHGTFNGQGIPVRNLTVTGYPEDIGAFGYISYDGEISGLILDTVTIKSTGYSNSSSDNTYKLFDPTIDDLFDEHGHYFVTDTSLAFKHYNGSTYQSTDLKVINGTGGIQYEHLDDSSNLVSGTNIYKGYFVPTYPTNVPNDPFTYSWISSSSLIESSNALGLDLDGDQNADNLIVFNLDLLAGAGDEQGEFNSGENMEVDARISLIASVTVNGYVYSRVIQSYTCEFFSNSSVYGDGNVSVAIYCDYVAPDTSTTHSTNYHHGNNIGFLAGHLDGSMSNCYVYEGTFDFNSGSEHHIICETQTGLIGEVGTNVINTINPDYSSSTTGEIGVMNFTRIYEGIRGNVTENDVIKGGSDAGYHYISYDTYINHNPANHPTNPSHFDLYEGYLRHNDYDPYNYITKIERDIGSGVWKDTTVPSISEANETIDYNSVDFLYNNVIEDEKDEQGNYIANRGLGVFKIATPWYSYTPGTAYGLRMYEKFGDCMVINGAPKTKVYFSTAEYDHTVLGQAAWGSGANDIQPLRATTLPSYSDVGSFDYPFSRDFNYVFELDLSQNSDSNGKNYMWNTDSMFLTNYLQSKLKDKYKRAIEPGNYRFGFMFRSAENKAINSLSAYMPISAPGNTKYQYQTGVYYPSNSIVFKIANDGGANVSVVGNKNDISIYGFNSATSSGGVTKLYTMKCANDSTMDSHRYFTYDYDPLANGATSTETVKYSENNMGDNKALYAHIFWLPKGDYVIGSADSTTKANLYYLAVQGQTDAEIGTTALANIGNTLTNVDFLLERPAKSDFPNSLHKAEFDFDADFNTNHGVFNVTTKTVSAEKYLSVEFVNSPSFVTSLFAYAYANDPKFYVNNSVYQQKMNVIPV